MPAVSARCTFGFTELYTPDRNFVESSVCPCPWNSLSLEKDTAFPAVRTHRQIWSNYCGVPGASSEGDERLFLPVIYPQSVALLSFDISQPEIHIDHNNVFSKGKNPQGTYTLPLADYNPMRCLNSCICFLIITLHVKTGIYHLYKQSALLYSFKVMQIPC